LNATDGHWACSSASYTPASSLIIPFKEKTKERTRGDDRQNVYLGQVSTVSNT
jgi:hypothetical protein